MAETVQCPVCGATNPDTLERCRACNQLLKQSTSELNGFGERIASGQTPTEKSTSELEKALPAWLRRARETDQNTPDAPEETPEPETPPATEPDDAPIIPDFSAEADEDDNDNDNDNDEINPLDWLSGLDDSGENEDDEEEAADWLVNLQGDLAPEEPEPPAPADVPATDEPITANVPPAPIEDVDEESPDWISNLQGDSQISPDELPDLVSDEESGSDADTFTTSDDEGVPDWLSRLSEEAEASTETPASVPAPAPQADATPDFGDANDELPDWMANLQSVGEVSDEDFPMPSQAAPETPVAETPDTELSPANDDLPDWIENLQTADETVPEAASDDSLPDWLSGEESAPEAAPEASSDDLPDWMSAPQVEEAEAASDDLPDWLSGDDTTPDVVSAEASESLSELDAALQAEEETLPEAETIVSDDDLPDWLSDEESTLETASEIISDDLPDWMSGEEPADESEPLSELGAGLEADKELAPAEASDDLPDWMTSLQADEEPSVETPVNEPETEYTPALTGDLPIESGGDLPDWLANLQGAGETEEKTLREDIFSTEASAQEGEASGAESADDAPDWLSRVGEPTTGSSSEAESSQEADLASDLEAADETPEWLNSLPVIDDVAEKESASEELASSPAFVDASAPLPDDETDEIFGIEMPDWLSSLGPDDLASEKEDAAATSPAAETDLSGAELPSWVQAMRPVASVVSSDRADEEHVVASGPLAGLNGILPVGTGMGPKNKPRAHAVKLQVSESQQSGAVLLERILASETEAAPQHSTNAPVSIPLLRWIVAALMLFVIVGSLLSPKEIIPSPNIAVPEIGDAVDVVNQLPAAGTALLVFDYEAGLSAEMQAAAAPLVDHLMLRGLKLALLSTTPNGPALAERFLQETQSQHQYQHGADYLNMGYLPGGASGMLSFVSNPRFAIAGQLDGTSFWDYAPLSGISNITDFSVVVVLTDDVEKGRTWIEQASVPLNASSTPIPFLMAISAQAEPIIYPYYASTQLDGLVSGLSGGATYERLQGQSGLGRKYWDSYSLGLFAAEIMIILGAVLNFVAGLRARQKLEKEDE